MGGTTSYIDPVLLTNFDESKINSAALQKPIYEFGNPNFSSGHE